MIIELARHGTRIPIVPVFEPLPEWSTRLPVSLLTDVGFRQHYYLGKQIADRFPQIFNKELKREQVYARSTRIQRTLGSAEAHLMGALHSSLSDEQLKEMIEFKKEDERQLPPYLSKHTFDGLLKTDPSFLFPKGFIPSHVFSHHVDIDYLQYFMNPSACPVGAIRHNQLIKEFKNDLSANYPGFVKVLEETSKVFGVNLDSFKHDLFLFAENIGDFVGLDWRNSLNPYVPRSSALYKKVRRVTETINTVALLDKEIRSSATAPFFFKIFEMMLKRTRNLSASSEMGGVQKYVFLSSHDTVLAPVLDQLNQISPECYLQDLKEGDADGACGDFPDTAANILFELLSINGQHYVRVYYNLNIIRLFGKEELPLQEFISNLSKQLNSNWKEYCLGATATQADDNIHVQVQESKSYFSWNQLSDPNQEYFWQCTSALCSLIFLAQIVLSYAFFKKAQGQRLVPKIASRESSTDSSLLNLDGLSVNITPSAHDSLL